MSQSPESEPDAVAVDAEEPYLRALGKINDMIHAGASLSGNERNCSFLNTGQMRFANISAITGLDYADDGRAVAQVDWDHDGDQDLWVTNRTGPRVRFLRNANRNEHSFVTVKLTGQDCNRSAIGARVEMVLSNDERIVRTVRAGEGFLSQSSKRLHFGIAAGSAIDRMIVHWPGGIAQTVEGLQLNRHYSLTQHGLLLDWQPPAGAAGQLQDKQQEDEAATSSTIRVALPSRVILPLMPYEQWDGKSAAFGRQRESPLLVNLWASWCQPCVRELSEWRRRADEFHRAGLDVLVLNVDDLDNSRPLTNKASREIEAKLELPFPSGRATDELVTKLQLIHNRLVRHGSIPVPTSLLLDRNGKLAAIYKGTVDVDQLMRDVHALPRDQASISDELPFAGLWYGKPPSPRYAPLLSEMLESDLVEDVLVYLSTIRADISGDPDYPELLVRVGNQLLEKRELDRSAAMYREALRLQPRLAAAWFDLGLTAELKGQAGEAIGHYRKAIQLDPQRAEAQLNLGVLLARRSQWDASLEHLTQSIAARPTLAIAHFHLGQVYEKLDRQSDAMSSYRKSHELDRSHVPTAFALARSLERAGEQEEARDLYEQVVAVRPRFAAAHIHLGVLMEVENPAVAIQHYRQALKLQPTSLSAQNNLAWLLATLPDPSLRNSTEALRWAERANEATNSEQPAILDTLAAAYANAEQFEKAVTVASRAIELATKRKQDELRTQLVLRLEMYRNRQPYRSD